MKQNKLIKLGAGLLALLLLLTACGEKESTPPETPTPETVQAFTPEEIADYTQKPETLSKLQALRASFSALGETDAADFSVETANGGVTITKYNGQALAVRIPAAIEGLPVTSVGKDAFSWNTTVETLYLPDSIKTLGESVLIGCSALTALRTPLLGADGQSEQYLGYLFGGESYADNAIDVPASLAYLELGGGMTELADYALFDCNDLLCVELPDTMTRLGTYALFQCSSLLAINVDGLAEIAPHALDSCEALTRLEFGEGLVSIGLGALEACTGLCHLTLPFVGGSREENLYLGYLFGAGAPDFSEGYFPTYLASIKLLPSCISLGAYAFYQCKSLTAIELPDTLTVIGVRAFADCVRLQELNLPDATHTIREEAFFGCISLRSLSFGEGSALSLLGINVFYRCSALTEVALPQSLATLPASAFADCFSLQSVDLGGVTRVEKQAFRRCTALTSAKAGPELVMEEGNDALKQLLTSE